MDINKITALHRGRCDVGRAVTYCVCMNTIMNPWFWAISLQSWHRSHPDPCSLQQRCGDDHHERNMRF